MTIFSLIVATLGRSFEIERLLDSLVSQNIGKQNFEVIIIDQNDNIDISSIIEKYETTLDIIHMKSLKKGLSLNRNIGIRHAKGEYICFPDDDCTYYPDTLSTAYKKFKESNADLALGAIRDRKNNEDIIRNWPNKRKTISKFNFWKLHSSITLFAKNNQSIFNESLGAGCYFGSCEDSDYIYKAVKSKSKVIYFNDIEVWHPKEGVEQFTHKKNISYGLGFGAFCSIHKKEPAIIYLFIKIITYHLTLALLFLLKGKIRLSKTRFEACTSRIRGLFEHAAR